MKARFARSFIIIAIFYTLYSTCAYGRTYYVVQEQWQDLSLFEAYINSLSIVDNPVEALKNIKLTDATWKEISHHQKNTISNLYYSEDGYVVLENNYFNFRINFYPKIRTDSICWTCEIFDNKSFLQHSSRCYFWNKEIYFGMVRSKPKPRNFLNYFGCI